MINPERRIMLFPVGRYDVEILLLGEPESIAKAVAEVSAALSKWIGFSNAQPVAMGTQVIGFRAMRDENATHDDAIAEALLMLRRFPVEWADAGPRAMVGSW